MKIGIAGMAGRMGRLLIEEAQAAGHEVVGGTINPNSAPAADVVVPILSLAALADAADAVIDFTHASTATGHGEILAERRAAWILGTSGLSLAAEAAVAVAAQRIPVVYAANFGPGITILLSIARTLGAALPAETYDAEIVEMHHRQKVDAPSGTAIALGRAVAAGRGVVLEEVMASGRTGHTGTRPDGAIGFAALRGGQVVGEHTVLFAAGSEHIAVSHRALDRRVFASGAVRAASWAVAHPPGLYGMEQVLGLWS